MGYMQKLAEQAELYGTYFRRSQESFDRERIIAREGEEGFRHELLLALEQKLFDEKVKELTFSLKKKFPRVSRAKVKELVIEHLREEKFPKPWRVRKAYTAHRKAVRAHRGY